jgi:hypothetical protein
LTCKECWLSVNLLAGAEYTYFDVEETRTTDGLPDPNLPKATSKFGETNYRLGLEARGDSFVFELMWEEADSSSILSRGISLPSVSSRDQVRNDVWTAALSLKF